MGRCLWILSIVSVVLLSACSAHKVAVSSGAGWIAKDVKKLKGLDDHQWGLALYDTESKKWIYRRKSNQYFTPASNTKMLTLCTALQYLGDSTIALRYVEQGDTLIFWGTGDPSAMYSVSDSNKAVDFVRRHPAKVVFYAPLEPVDKYGPGWAWDDYGYSYQVERSTLPVYGNRLTFTKLALELEGTVTPDYFKDYVVEDPSIKRFVERLPEANAFSINISEIDDMPFEKSVPFVVSDYDLAAIWSGLTGREIELKYDFDHPALNKSISGSPTDSLYKLMMQESDNFIAEQLMIQIADKLGLPLGVDTVIHLMQGRDFADVPQAFQWFDGSGLSRYNLFTPESLVWLLNEMLVEYGFDYLKEVFPAGGKSGTIEEWYGLPGNVPFIYAKTGTLRNHHCLSGYLITKSSKVLTFSFMHSNYIGSSSQVKSPMEKLLKAIYEKY